MKRRSVIIVNLAQESDYFLVDRMLSGTLKDGPKLFVIPFDLRTEVLEEKEGEVQALRRMIINRPPVDKADAVPDSTVHNMR